LAPVSCLAGRAGQSALGAATPSSLSYDEGANFRRRSRQGYKKSVGKNKKLLADNMSWDKTLSIIQTNFIVKAFI
jgi:hypothetical protein